MKQGLEKGLERVFSEGHELYDRIVYDIQEGAYYDKTTDIYLTLEEAAAFIPALQGAVATA